MVLKLVFLGVLSLTVACTPKKVESPGINQVIAEPLSPEKTGELITKVGQNWVYGQGLGETALTVGTIVVFPPYALYAVGNAILDLAGYERMDPTRLLPEKAEKAVNSVYDTVTQAPGRGVAKVAGVPFRDRETIKNDFNQFFAYSTTQNGDSRDSSETSS